VIAAGDAPCAKHRASRHVGRLTKYNTLTGNTWGVRSPVFTRNHPPGTSRAKRGIVMRGWVIPTCLILGGCTSPTPSPGLSAETQQSTRDVVECLRQAAVRLDDFRSDATSVAYGIVGACTPEINRSIEAGAQGLTFDGSQTFRSRTNAFYLKAATEVVLSERASRSGSAR
jgi:hypothetical protein